MTELEISSFEPNFVEKNLSRCASSIAAFQNADSLPAEDASVKDENES